MSKIICDVCGTAYPETATQCPICGYSKEPDEQAVAVEPSNQEVTYVYTKGGRFSKRNVRLRNRKSNVQDNRSTAVAKSEEHEEKTSVGLIIVVIALLLAIIAVVVYIGIRFFSTDEPPVPTNEPSASQTDALTIPCTDLTLSNSKIEFRLSGNAWLLEAVCTPADTTDKVIFSSDNDKVAMVSEDGCVTAIGGGETVIRVTCGDITRECQIICSFDAIEDPTEGETEHVTSAPIDPDFEFKFNAPDKYRDPDTGKWDTTITTPNSTWRAYKRDMTVRAEDIIWTSDDPAIASIDSSGIVTAVAPGTTEVHAQYGEKIYTCIVRCSWKVKETEPVDGDEDATEAETKGIRISTKDATVKVGESFYLRLIDANDKNIEVQWTASEEGYVTIEGNKITGVKGKLAGVTVSTTYEGVTYSAIVRINAE